MPHTDDSPPLRPQAAEDWIVAPATAPGAAAVAMLRLDGPGCWDCAARLLPRRPAPPPPRRCVLRRLHAADGAPIDEAMLVRFAAPASYTGNDLVEFHCHGSPAVLARLLRELLAAGARMARPGEFTERAFFNGKLDLAQAEGVANLVSSQTEAASRAALRQVQGALSQRIGALRESLLDIAAEIEARLDFPEEEIEARELDRLDLAMDESLGELDALLNTARRGRLQRDGARVVLAGPPNAGKSSLFNALVGRERAIVSPHPGTTRDSLEATVDIAGLPITLVDTAGLRERGAGEIEALGIARSLEELAEADLALLLVDAPAALRAGPDEAQALARAYARMREALEGRPALALANKWDALAPEQHDAARRRLGGWFGERALEISAAPAHGLESIERALPRLLLGADPAAMPARALVTNLRHAEHLRKAREALLAARGALAGGASGELVMIDLQDSLDALGDILGLRIDGEILSRIFSRFCIGK